MMSINLVNSDYLTNIQDQVPGAIWRGNAHTKGRRRVNQRHCKITIIIKKRMFFAFLTAISHYVIMYVPSKKVEKQCSS